MKTSLRVAAAAAAATLSLTALSSSAQAAGYIGQEPFKESHNSPQYWGERLGGTCFKLKGNVKHQVDIQLPTLPTQATVIVKAGDTNFIYTADSGEFFTHNQKGPKDKKVKNVAQVIVCHSIKNDETPAPEPTGTETTGTETTGTETTGTETTGKPKPQLPPNTGN